MFAVEVTFDFSSAAGLSALGITPAAGGSGVTVTDLSLNGVNFAANKGTATTDPRVWTTTSGATDFRTYNGSTLTISGAQASDLITKIEMSGNKLNFTGLSNGQWTGSANSVTFTPTATCNVATITITMNEQATEYIPDTITVSQAKALIDAYDPLMHKGHFVKGVVAGDPFLLGSNGPAFYLTDITNPTDTLEGFKIAKDAQSTAFTGVDDMAATLSAGDTILIYAAGLALYNNMIYETTSGYFAGMIGKVLTVMLDWHACDADRDGNVWNVLIAYEFHGNPDNRFRLYFSSEQDDAIQGTYNLESGSTITINGVTSEVSGTVSFTYKAMLEDGTNTYTINLYAHTSDKTYRMNRDIDFVTSYDLDGDRPFVPNDGDTITCAQAKKHALSLATGETSSMTVTVRGFITDIFSNGITFWMDDQQGTAKTIQAYSCTMPTGVNVVNDTEVFVTGKLKNYNGTPEIDHGTVEVISGGEETPDPIIPDTASHNTDAKLWPIVMDGIYAHANAEYIVGDIRMDGEDNHLYVWASGETYTPVSRGGKNFYGNNEGYLAFDVAAPDGWSGMGFCVENAQSISAIQALKENIVNNPDDIYLHMAIKSTTAGNHEFYTFGTNATSFTLGTASIQDGPVIGDFERDGKWHELFIPMAPFASAISTVDVRSGINILCILSGNAVGAQLDLDAIYFCDMAFMNKAIKPLPEPEDFDVIYRNQDNEIIDSEQVTLTLPEAPIISGFTFLKWVVVAGDLDEGINIQATYQYNGDATSAPSVFVNPANPAQKLIRNGNVYILHNGNTYTATGVKVE